MRKSAVDLLEMMDKSLDLDSHGPHAIPVLSGELTRWEEGNSLNVLSLDDGKLVLKVHEGRGDRRSTSMGRPLSEVWVASKGNPARAKRVQNKRVLLETFDFRKVEMNGRTEVRLATILEAIPTEGRKYPRVLFEDQTIGLVVEPKNLEGLYRNMDKVQVIKNEDSTVRIVDNGYLG
jgi:hypothetical protein